MTNAERIRKVREALAGIERAIKEHEKRGTDCRLAVGSASATSAIALLTVEVDCTNCRGRGTIGSAVMNGPDRCPMTCKDGKVSVPLEATL